MDPISISYRFETSACSGIRDAAFHRVVKSGDDMDVRVRLTLFITQEEEKNNKNKIKITQLRENSAQYNHDKLKRIHADDTVSKHFRRLVEDMTRNQIGLFA